VLRSYHCYLKPPVSSDSLSSTAAGSWLEPSLFVTAGLWLKPAVRGTFFASSLGASIIVGFSSYEPVVKGGSNGNVVKVSSSVQQM